MALIKDVIIGTRLNFFDFEYQLQLYFD